MCPRHCSADSLAAHGKDCGAARCPPAAHEGPHTRGGGYALRATVAQGNSTVEQIPAGTVACGRGSMQEKVFLAGPLEQRTVLCGKDQH